MSPDGKVLVNTSETTNMAHFIDTETHKTFDNVLVDSRPRIARFNARRQPALGELGGRRHRHRDRSQRPARSSARSTSRSPASSRRRSSPSACKSPRTTSIAFVALGPANRVAVVDTSTLKVLKYLLVGQRVWHMAFTPDYKLLLTTNGTSNDVSVIDVATLKVIKSIRVGRYPWGVVVAPF